ncbi:hypothetical protein COLO4_13374 [Corchorus olitorius]|uniref:U5 small nuclear ribonucleoprotein TSSC4 n=1 Tax=Corchorus olitorius TaxID=93759 RepID=A0A1R3JWT1_9ROSI|nr:hypothetical protein COLO4_13374 [Corchorus olitorius]
MEDSFNVRVDKVFGSLASSSSHSSSKPESLSSLWSLTDDEIERREWNRDKGSPEPEEEEDRLFEKFRQKKTTDFGKELEKDLDDLDDEDGDDGKADAPSSSSKGGGGGKPDDYNDEEWEIKSAIGRDCTLDNEEEEDEYDKVAVGREKAGDRLYMKDVNDYDVDADSYNELPTTLRDFNRDPRANHIAAKLRLKEDAETAKRRLEEDTETAKKIDSLRMSDSDAPAAEDANIKSILKRKDAESNPKSEKRVRFDSECKSEYREGPEGTKDVRKETCPTEEEEAMVSNETFTLPPDYPSGIPDYMRNPSKYTRYTFDSGDVDDASNRQAYMDLLKLIKKSDATEPQEDDGPVDLTKPVTFIPRKKTGDVIMGEICCESKQRREDPDKESMERRGLPIGIAVGDDTNNGVCAMEEDEPQPSIDRINNSQRSGRQYRTKPSSDFDD